MIEIKDLSFSYSRESLFSDLNLNASPGNIYGLLGKNGAGKTTLLKLLSGMRFPKSGVCQVMGHKPRNRSPLLLQELFIVPETFSLPAVTMTKYRKLYAPFYPRFNGEGLEDYVEEFELDPEKNLKTCSYGQKKKFLIAFCLASGCRLMLLDEPTNGLDIPSKSVFRKRLAAILSDDRIVMISAHHVRDLENLIDSVIILDKGRIIFNHSMAEVSSRLSVNLHREIPDEAGVLHAENIMGHYAVVTEDTNGNEKTDVSLEMLFNTVMMNREKISGLFSQ